MIELLEGKGARDRIGRIAFGEEGLRFRSKYQVLRDLVLAALLSFLAVSGLLAATWPHLLTLGGSLLLALAYCVAAYFVRPLPRHDRLGLLDGMLDHPFRYSDDVNRALLWSAAVLWPGRYLVQSWVDGVRYFACGRLPHERMDF